MNLNNLLIKTYILVYLLVPSFILAQGSGGSNSGTGSSGGPAVNNGPGLTNPLEGKVDSISGLIQVILVGVVKIGIPIVALALVYSGFLFVSARGNPEGLAKAKRALLYSLIGAALLIGSWAIAQMISDTVLLL